MRRVEGKAIVVVALVVSYLAAIFYIYSRPDENGFGAEHDFVTVIAGTRCAIDGCNPYDAHTVENEFRKMGGYTPFEHFLPEWPLYPPSTLFLLLPFSLLRWPALSVVWMLLCFGFLAAAFSVLIVQFKAYRGLLSLAPFLILLVDRSLGWAVQLGQPTLIAASSAAIAVVFLVSETMPALGAALLALSLCLKPQVAFVFGLYLLLRKGSRRPALAAYLITAAAAIAGTLLFYFRLSSFAYLGNLRANLRLAVQPGRDDDPSVLNVFSQNFLNLQAFLSRFTHRAHVYNGVTYAVVLALAAVLVFCCLYRKTGATRPYTIVAVLVMLELLATYHRLYDHWMLLAAIPGLLEIKSRSTVTYVVALCGFCLFFVSRLHGAWLHGWGPIPLGPPVEIFLALVFLGSLWSDRGEQEDRHSAPCGACAWTGQGEQRESPVSGSA